MERPRRDQFKPEEAALYKAKVREYVDWVLGRNDRYKATLESLHDRLVELEKLFRPTDLTLGEKAHQMAGDIITDRYSLTDQANITRKAARAGASRDELVALEEMDNFIESVLDAHEVHQKAISELDPGVDYDLTAGWPKEA